MSTMTLITEIIILLATRGQLSRATLTLMWSLLSLYSCFSFYELSSRLFHCVCQQILHSPFCLDKFPATSENDVDEFHETKYKTVKMQAIKLKHRPEVAQKICSIDPRGTTEK